MWLIRCRAVIGTIIRIPFGHSFVGYKGDFLYQTSPIAALSSLEIGLGIVAANAATFRPLLQRIWPRLFGDSLGRQPTDHLYDQEAAWAALQRVQKRAGLADQNRGTLTFSGGEAIEDVPGLILARDITKMGVLVCESSRPVTLGEEEDGDEHWTS